MKIGRGKKWLMSLIGTYIFLGGVAGATTYTSTINVTGGDTVNLGPGDTLSIGSYKKATVTGAGSLLNIQDFSFSAAGSETLSGYSYVARNGGTISITDSEIATRMHGFEAGPGGTIYFGPGTVVTGVLPIHPVNSVIARAEGEGALLEFDGVQFQGYIRGIASAAAGGTISVKNSVINTEFDNIGGDRFFIASYQEGSKAIVDNLTIISGIPTGSSTTDNYAMLVAAYGGELEVTNSHLTATNGHFALESNGRDTTTNKGAILKASDILIDYHQPEAPSGYPMVITAKNGGQIELQRVTVNIDYLSSRTQILTGAHASFQAVIQGDQVVFRTTDTTTGRVVGALGSRESVLSFTDSLFDINSDNSRGVLLYDGSALIGQNFEIISLGSSSLGIQSRSGVFALTGSNTIQLTNSSILSEGDGISLDAESATFAGNTQNQVNLVNTSVTSLTGMGINHGQGESEISLAGARTIVQGSSSTDTVGVSNGTRLELEILDQAKIMGNIGVKQNSILNLEMDQGIVEGDISALDTSTVNLQLTNNSLWTGATQTDNLVADIESSQWIMTKDSSLKELTLADQGTVAFSTDLSGGTYGTLTMQDLKGSNGLFIMRTDLVGDGAGNNRGDLLLVTGDSGTGSHQVHVTNNGSADTDGTERLTIIDTNTGSAEFALTNVVELGGYQYKLRQHPDDGSNWELYGIPRAENPGPSNPADSGVNLFSAGYLLNYVENQTLLKRLGDLRGGKDSNGIWARSYGGKFETNGDGFLRGYDMDYWGLQAGYDKKIERKDQKGTVYVGGFFGYSKGNVDYRYGSGEIDSKSLGAYWTHLSPNGFYADLVFKYGWMKDEFHVFDSAGNPVQEKNIRTQGFSGSLELGRRYHFDQKEKQGWYIEPQAQLTVGHQSGDRFTASNGLRIKMDSYRSLLGRVGTHVGYEVKEGKNPVNIYAKWDWVKEFDGDVGYMLNNSREETSYGGSWHVWGVGATMQFANKHNLYLEVERASGGRFTQSWAISGGYRFTW